MYTMGHSVSRPEGWATNVVQGLRSLVIACLALLVVGCDGLDDLVGACRPAADTESYAFDVAWTRVVQGNQTASNLAPLLAERPAGIEVLLTMAHGELRPRLLDVSATVEVIAEGATVGSLELTLGCVRSERSAMRGTIPGAWVRPGAEVHVTLRSGTMNVTVPDATIVVEPIVAKVPTFEVTVVPLIVGGEHPDTSPDTYEAWLDAAKRRFAIDRVDLEVHAPLDLDLGDECVPASKFPALRELIFYRTSLESERFFVGVLPCSVGGVAMMPGFVQVTSPGIGATRVFIHELGHNFGLGHAPCGDPLGIDPAYPYEDGVLGLPGFDHVDGTWIAASQADVMGYCAGSWTSDYHYARSARYRLYQERPLELTPLADAAMSVSIVVQGELGVDGSLRLTHAARRFEPTTRSMLDAAAVGEGVSLELLGRDGAVLARWHASLMPVDHVDTRLFSARIAVSEADGLAALVVRATHGAQWDERALVDAD